MLKHSLIALAAMGAGLLGFPATQASAFTPAPAPAIQSDANPLMTQVRDRGMNGGMNRGWNGNNRYNRYNNNWNNHRYNRRYHGNRCGSWSNNCRYRYGNYWYQNPWWLVGSGVALGVGIGAATAYDGGGGGYGSRHVAWCLNRYQSYNPRYNTWVAYSGAVRQCISPYGP
ncbi:BA14K family protein [Aestuariivirga sp.]|uniref:BA14K family protein n=1 Tax=Aestuariivirga sp. TaxID=2650926 RepID=UPI003BAC6D4C